MLAALFAPDGAFESQRGGGSAAQSAGRSRQRPRPDVPETLHRQPRDRPAPGGATGHAYVVEVDLPSDGEKLGGDLSPTGGRYEDVYEKDPAGWRFKSRRFVPSKMEVPGAAARPAAAPAPRQSEARSCATAARETPCDEGRDRDRPVCGNGGAARAASTAASPAKAAALTPADYIEIQQLVSKYGYALDSGAPEGTGKRGRWPLHGRRHIRRARHPGQHGRSRQARRAGEDSSGQQDPSRSDLRVALSDEPPHRAVSGRRDGQGVPPGRKPGPERCAP